MKGRRYKGEKKCDRTYQHPPRAQPGRNRWNDTKNVSGVRSLSPSSGHEQHMRGLGKGRFGPGGKKDGND